MRVLVTRPEPDAVYEAELISEESRFDDAEPDDQPRGCLIGGGPGGGAPCAPVAGVLPGL